MAIKWRSSFNVIIEQAFGGDKTRLYAAQSWHRLYSPFVPFATGYLSNNVDRYIENGVAINKHKAIYAHYLYEGIVYIDPKINAAGFLTDNGWFSRRGISKIKTDRALSYSEAGHPLATAHWDKVALQAGKQKELVKDLQNYVNGGIR